MIKKAVVIADCHYPHYDKKVFEIIKQITKDTKPDYLVYLGDCIDANGISKFTAKNFAEGALETVEEIKGFKKDYFEPLQALLKPKAKTIWTFGNHTQPRIDDFLSKLADSKYTAQYKLYKDLLNIPKYFPEATFRDYNDFYKIGKLVFTHGEYHSKNHALKHVTDYGKSVMYGHMHTYEVATATTKGTKKVHSAISIPCSCRLDMKYKKKRSSSWVNGLAVVDFLPNGDFHEHILKIINGKTIYNNKIYG